MTSPPVAGDLFRPPGPWTHRDVSANGSRFHVAELGEGPMVVLLHGFPLFWWVWRHHVEALAAHGFHAVAMDLRGYGGSDHTPHGYDPLTLAADVAGVVRSIGGSDAVIVGQGLGGLIAWTLGALYPESTRGVAVLAAAHPRRLRAEALRRPAQAARLRFAVGMQVPFLPERALTAHGAQRVEEILRAGSATAWPDEAEADVYRQAMLTPSSAYCAAEFYRWALRSVPRRDGRRFARAISEPVLAPVLQIHGRLDPVVLPSTVDGSEDYVKGTYRREDLECGHFPQAELPKATAEILLDWLAGI